MENRVKVPVEAVGTYHLTSDIGQHLDLFDTFYVPSISCNLIYYPNLILQVITLNLRMSILVYSNKTFLLALAFFVMAYIN